MNRTWAGLAFLLACSAWAGERRFSNYQVYKNNCHTAANRSDEFVHETTGNTWGVFSCIGALATETAEGHTVTWVHLENEGKMCLIEPQNPKIRSCWKATKLELSLGKPDPAGDPQAKRAAKKLCGEQYTPPKKKYGAYSSQPLDPGDQATQPGAATCVKWALGAPLNQKTGEHLRPSVYSPQAQELSANCLGCCQAESDQWKKPVKNVPGTGKRGAREFLGRCRALCKVAFLEPYKGEEDIREAQKHARAEDWINTLYQDPNDPSKPWAGSTATIKIRSNEDRVEIVPQKNPPRLGSSAASTEAH